MAPLALLPFFDHFRNAPHQLAAIKQLEESLPKELLEDDAAWFEAWKASGIDQQVFMPYFSQLDNKTGFGYRECFPSRLLGFECSEGRCRRLANDPPSSRALFFGA